MGLLCSLDDARGGWRQRRPRLLVADNDAGAGAVLVEMLGLLGYQAHWAPSADDALAACAAEPLDGVLCEVGLRSGDGRPLTDLLAECYPDLAVGILTAHLSHGPARAAVVAHKPVSLADLRWLTQSLLLGLVVRPAV